MPISVKCSCGKQVTAPDKFAGKRVKCPACSSPIQVPGAQRSNGGDTANIAVSCQCGKRFAAPEKLAGKAVKCPECQNPVRIPPSRPAAASGGSPKITTRCQCGTSFPVPRNLAGKAVRCPGCKQPVRVPVAEAPPQDVSRDDGPSKAQGDSEVGGMDSLLDEIGFQRAAAANRCPECKEDLDEDAVLCIRCGFNLEKGKRLETEYVGRRAPAPGAPGGTGNSVGPFGSPVPKPVQSAAMILNVLGALGLSGVVLLVLFFVLVSNTDVSTNPELQETVAFAKGGLVFYSILAGGSALLYFFTATMLKKGSKIGRIIAIVLGVLTLVAVPIGTLIGGMLLFQLFKEDARRFCS